MRVLSCLVVVNDKRMFDLPLSWLQSAHIWYHWCLLPSSGSTCTVRQLAACCVYCCVQYTKKLFSSVPLFLIHKNDCIFLQSCPKWFLHFQAKCDKCNQTNKNAPSSKICLFPTSSTYEDIRNAMHCYWKTISNVNEM